MMRKQGMWVIIIGLFSLLFFWAPWIAKIDSFWGISFGGHGTETVVQNFDGLQYLTVAKTMYDRSMIESQFAQLNNPASYYAAHFPAYPLVIRIFYYFMNGPKAALTSIIVNNILLATSLYLFFQEFLEDKRKATFATILSLFFPARMLSVRSVMSSEPVYISSILISLILLKKKNYWGAAILGAIAMLTRINAMMYLAAIVMGVIINNESKSKKLAGKIRMLLPFTLIPATLLSLFFLYQWKLGDFWAYFRSSSELHPVGIWPLKIFSNTSNWVSGMWREEFVYLFAFYGAGILMWFSRKKSSLVETVIKIYLTLYAALLVTTAHQDLARYALPIAPIVMVEWIKLIDKKYLKWGLLLVIPAYLLGWQFVVGNVQAVSDWTTFL